jgi:hypothetical protein
MHQGTADLRADGKPHNSQEPFHPEGSAKAGAEIAGDGRPKRGKLASVVIEKSPSFYRQPLQGDFSI